VPFDIPASASTASHKKEYFVEYKYGRAKNGIS